MTVIARVMDAYKDGFKEGHETGYAEATAAMIKKALAMGWSLPQISRFFECDEADVRKIAQENSIPVEN